MRRLTAKTGSALRLSAERGATMVFLAIGAAVLFGFVALAFDFGRMFVERRELQSGADAAALAIAYDCAGGDCGPGYDGFAVAEQYADANASDELAWVRHIELDREAQEVTVHTATEDPGGDHHFDMMFAQLVGYSGLTVSAKATVAWGSPGKLVTLPLVFSLCEWEVYGDSGFVESGGWLHHTEAMRAGMFAADSGYLYADRAARIFFHGNWDCALNASGQDLPGGFGWLTTDGVCSTTLQVGDWVGLDPGTSPSNGCNPDIMLDLLGQVVMIPYFDDTRGTGETAEYHIDGFGALYVTGYNFAGLYTERSTITGGHVCVGEDRCIEGYFIGDWVAPDGELGGPDRGVKIVKFAG